MWCLPVLALLVSGAEPVWRPLGEPGCGGRTTAISISPWDSKRVLVGGDMLGVAISLDRGESWSATSGFKSWEIADFTWHPESPKTVWVGTMSGPYVSEDSGVTWAESRRGLPEKSDSSYSAPIQQVLFDPADSHRLLSFGGSSREWSSPGAPLWGAVWESRDDGKTWKLLSTVKSDSGTGLNIVAAAWSGDSIFAATLTGGVFKSVDGGKSWGRASNGLPHLKVKDLVAHPKKPGVLWAALNNSSEDQNVISGGIFTSVDGGLSWKSASKGLRTGIGKDENLTPRYEAIAISAADPRRLITCDTSWDGGVVYISKDEGVSWQPSARRTELTMPLPAGLGQTVVAWDPKAPDVAYSAGSEHVIRTLNGGVTWTDVASKPTPTGWSGRGYSGWVSTNFKFDPLTRDRSFFLGMDAAVCWQSRDAGRTWTRGRTGLPDWGGSSDLAFAGPQTLYVTLGQGNSFEGIAQSLDGGLTWKVLEGPSFGLPSLGSPAGKAVSVYALPANPQIVYATIGGALYRSTNAGALWGRIHEGPGLTWIAGVPNQARRFFVAGSEGVYRSDDGQRLTLMPDSPAPATRIAVDAMPNVYATSWRGKGGLWRWNMGTWTQLASGLRIAAVAVDPTNVSRIAIVTNEHPFKDDSECAGVQLSLDGGATWTPLNTGLPMLRGEVLAFNPFRSGELVFGTNGRGFWVVQL